MSASSFPILRIEQRRMDEALLLVVLQLKGFYLLVHFSDGL